MTDYRWNRWLNRAILAIPVGYLCYGLWLADWPTFRVLLLMAPVWLAGAVLLGLALDRVAGPRR